MADESIGGVSVSITGDASGLGPTFTAAQSQAQQAGTAIASSFNAGAAGADQITAAVERLTVALREESAASSLAAQRNAALSKSVSQFGQAAQGAHLNTRFLVFGLKDLAEGRGTFAMAELVNVVSRLGPVFIGAAAGLAVMAIPLLSAIVKTKELTDAEKELADATQASDDAFAHAEQTLTELTVKEVAASGGAVLGKNAEIVAMQQRLARIKTDIQDAADKIPEIAAAGAGSIKNYVPIISESHSQATIDKIKAQGQVVKDLAQQYRELQGQIDAATGKDLPRLQAQQSGAAGGTQEAGKLAAINRETEAFKASAALQIDLAHIAAEATIKGIEDAGSREIAEAAQRVRVAQATEQTITNIQAAELPKRLAAIQQQGNDEAAGKSRPEQGDIAAKTKNDLAAAKGESDKEIADAHGETLKAEAAQDEAYVSAQHGWMKEIQENWTKAYEQITKDRDHTFLYQAEKEAKAYVESLRAAIGQAQIAETVAKAQGEVATAQVKAQYEQQGVHSLAQEITYHQELLVIQKQEQEAELNSLQAKLKAADALEDETEKSRQVLEIQQQIAALKGKSEAANIGAQGQIDNLQQNPFQKLGEQFKSQGIGDVQAQMAKNIASGVDGVAAALARATVQGKNFGQALAQAGKHMATSLLTTVIEAGLKRVLSGLISLVPAFSAVSGAQAAAAAKANATAKASVLTAAGEAAAWAFESVMAALPFPVNVSVAPGVAASSFAQTTAFGAFADGTDSAPGGMALVGEKGPEIMHVPKGAQIIPNHKIGKYADGTPNFSRATSRSSSMSIGELHVHAHGVNDPGTFARQAVAAIPHELKRQSSTFSPYSS